MTFGKSAVLLAFLAFSASDAGARELKVSFANGTDRLVDSAYMQCDAGDGALTGMGGEMFLHPGRTGSYGTDGERISSFSFGIGAKRYDFSDFSAFGGDEAAVRLCTGADGLPELHGVPGGTVPESCGGDGALVIKGSVYAPLDGGGDGGRRVPLDMLLSQEPSEILGSYAPVEGEGPLYEGFRFLRGDAAGCPLSVRVEFGDPLFGSEVRKTVVSGASGDIGRVLGCLREKGMVPVFVQLKSGDSQEDMEHRSFFGDDDAVEAWEVLNSYLQAVREGGDIPSATFLLVSGADVEKARSDSPDITAVRGDFSRAADFSLAVCPHAAGLIEAVR